MNAPYSPEGRGEQPVQAAVVPPYMLAPAPKKNSVLGKLLFVLLLLAFFGSLVLNLLLIVAVGISAGGGETRIQEQYVSHQRHANHKVAILSIEGVIAGGEGFFKRQLDQAYKDHAAGDLKALVIRVNSPGGTISGSDYMLHHLRKFREETRIPVVVSMGAIAASGGYYVSMAVGDAPDSIFAEPTTWTGSIGVIIPHYNLAGLMKEIGVESDEVTSHHLKGMGSFARPMTDEEKKIFQGLVNEGFARFKEAIQSGRPKFKADPAALDKLATGQIFTADQAKESGLVDQVGFLEKAVERAIALANVPSNDVSVVRYKSEPTLADLILGGQAKSSPGLDLAAILDSATPRAYYLCTWLPISTAKPE
ncbi:MAG: signal peptide peptidase SppA [Pirellulales bacterium]|nr:signal peptide peptidase SppA [Pirellulales bacterium]